MTEELKIQRVKIAIEKALRVANTIPSTEFKGGWTQKNAKIAVILEDALKQLEGKYEVRK